MRRKGWRPGKCVSGRGGGEESSKYFSEGGEEGEEAKENVS